MELKVSITTKGKIFEGKAPEIIQEARQEAMYEATSYLEALVKQFTPTGVYGVSGGLISRIYGEVLEMGSKGIVGHGSPYGDVIEKGRRAGTKWPPEGALLRWIEMKIGATGKAAESLEFLVRRKIGRKGFPGAHMFDQAFKKGWPKLKEIFDRAGFKIARKLGE